MKISKKTLSKESIKILESYDWPGNVRELRNILERGVNLSSGSEILPEHLPERFLNKAEFTLEDEKIELLSELMAKTEKKAIEKALILTKGNKSLASKELGIHRTALYKKLDKYEIK